MLTHETYDAYCASLRATTKVVQWGGAHVWKVGGKVFAIGGWQDGDDLFITFKCSWASFDILKEQAGCRPAPYLASRGMSWIQITGNDTLSDEDVRAYIAESHRLVAAGLTKKLQRELGLDRN